MRKLALLIIIFLSSTLLNSCYDAVEVDDLLHVNILGIERGVSDKWRITIKFPTLKGTSGSDSGGGASSGGVGGKSAEYATLTVDAPSFFTGIDMLNTTVAREINFMHTEALIISEDLAKSGILGEFLSPMIRFRQIRRSMHVIILSGSVMDTLTSIEPVVGTTLSKNLEILFEESSKTGFFPHSTLQNFYDSMKSTYAQPTAILGAVGNPYSLKQSERKWGNKFKAEGNYYAGDLPVKGYKAVELFGAAVFDGDKMVGQLTGEEARLMQIINGKFRDMAYTMPDPQNPSLIVALNIRQKKKPAVAVKFDGDIPLIHLKAELEGDILAIQSSINYENPDNIPILEKAFEKEIKNELDKLIDKSLSLKTDIFGFGQFAAIHFLTIQEWKEYNWIKKYQDSKISTEVKFTIRRTGTQLKNSPIFTTEETK